MYWNTSTRSGESPSARINRNMRCIEISTPPTWKTMKFLINRNMRCIEIRAKNRKSSRVSRINRNMRCIEMFWHGRFPCLPPRLIETWDVLKLHQIHLRYSGFPGINRNMRCIEIITVYGNRGIVERLIETWDVLKYKLVNVYTFCFCRLIETWDVLKCNLTNYIISSDSINRNMRCIEMYRIEQSALKNRWLIETWDVLKFRRLWSCPPLLRLIETWDVLK